MARTSRVTIKPSFKEQITQRQVVVMRTSYQSLDQEEINCPKREGFEVGCKQACLQFPGPINASSKKMYFNVLDVEIGYGKAYSYRITKPLFNN
jgi:hypothetical protein